MIEKNKLFKPDEDTIRREFDIIRGARRGDIEEVGNAIQEDPGCINRQDETNGLTALHFAASNGHFSMVDLLCEAEGVITNIPDHEGRTPAHLAWVIGRTDIKSRINRERDERLRARLDVEDTADNVTVLRPNRGPKNDL